MTHETARPPAPEQRLEMIAIAAYYLAEHRHFAPGGAEADWFGAERMVDAMLADHRLRRTTGDEGVRTSIRNALLIKDESVRIPEQAGEAVTGD